MAMKSSVSVMNFGRSVGRYGARLPIERVVRGPCALFPDCSLFTTELFLAECIWKKIYYRETSG
jgi:hypothetical protein